MTHADAVRLAYAHAKACHVACSKALDLLDTLPTDDEPLGGDDDIGPVSFGDNVKPNPQGK